MRVTKRLLPLKAHYFFFFGCMAPILPFVLVLAVQLGIPVPLQGSLSAVSLLFTITGKPLVAALADVFPSYRRAIFLAVVSIMVASFSAIKFIPSLQEPIAIRGTLVRNLKSQTDGTNQSVVTKSFLGDVTADVNIIIDSGTVSSSKNSEIPLQLDANPPTEKYPTSAGNLHGQLMLLTSSDAGLPYIAGGRGCSFVCSPSWFCPTKVTNNKVLPDFILKPIPNYSRLQVISNHTSAVQDDIFPIHSTPGVSHGGNELSSGRLYELEGVQVPLDSMTPNVSIKCKSGDWISGTDGHAAAWKSWQFWLLAGFLIVGQMAFNTAVSITDAITVDTVGDNGSYGVQRAWGTIGWGVMAPISGLLVDWWSGSSSTKDYTPAFLMCFIAGAVDVILSSVYLKVPEIKDESNILKNLWPLLKEPRIFAFCCFVVLNGCFDGIVVNYIFVMQEDMARGTSVMDNMKFLQGLTLLVQGAVEAPFMFVYGWFMKRLGAQKVTSMVFFLYIFRLFGLYLVGQYGSVWTTLIPELLNGPCYGLGYTAIVVYAAKITPAGTSNTVQSVVNICYESFGYALAMFVGGLIYNQVGGPYMYLMASGVAALTFICHIISLILLPPPKENNESEENMASIREGIPQEDPELKALNGNESS